MVQGVRIWSRVLEYGPGCYNMVQGVRIWFRVLEYGPGC